MNEYIELRIPPCADLECLPQPGHESGSVCISNVVWKEEEEAGSHPAQGHLPTTLSYLGLQSGLLALPLLLETLDFGRLLLQQRVQWRLQAASLLEGHFHPLKIKRPKSQKIRGRQ